MRRRHIKVTTNYPQNLWIRLWIIDLHQSRNSLALGFYISCANFVQKYINNIQLFKCEPEKT